MEQNYRDAYDEWRTFYYEVSGLENYLSRFESRELGSVPWEIKQELRKLRAKIDRLLKD